MDKKGRRRSKNSTISQHTHTIPHTTKRNRNHFRTGTAPNTQHFLDSERTDLSAAASLRVAPVTTRPTLSFAASTVGRRMSKKRKTPCRRHTSISKVHHHHHSFLTLLKVCWKR
mmetsp:Transcript_32012/g.35945  ORF Transcript_32012/g.35945 Transcript_32012/m.35945 type:complete len:114 (+) Transcript_32012:84-425(+)